MSEGVRYGVILDEMVVPKGSRVGMVRRMGVPKPTTRRMILQVRVSFCEAYRFEGQEKKHTRIARASSRTPRNTLASICLSAMTRGSPAL